MCFLVHVHVEVLSCGAQYHMINFGGNIYINKAGILKSQHEREARKAKGSTFNV